jgi:hypothetical protein
MGKPDALSRREQDLPADYDDERVRSRFIRLFQNKHLRSVQTQSLSSEEMDLTKEIRVFEDQDMQDLCDGSWGKDVTRATCVVLALLPLSMCTFQTRIHQRYVM